MNTNQIVLSVIVISKENISGRLKTLSSIDKHLPSFYAHKIHIDIVMVENSLHSYSSFFTFSNKCHRVTEILGQDKGIYDAFNIGINLCRGDYIGIINSDDVYTKDALKII